MLSRWLILLVFLFLPGTHVPLSHSLTLNSNVSSLGSGPMSDRPCQVNLQSSVVAHATVCKCIFIGMVIDEELPPVPSPTIPFS